MFAALISLCAAVIVGLLKKDDAEAVKGRPTVYDPDSDAQTGNWDWWLDEGYGSSSDAPDQNVYDASGTADEIAKQKAKNKGGLGDIVGGIVGSVLGGALSGSPSNNIGTPPINGNTGYVPNQTGVQNTQSPWGILLIVVIAVAGILGIRHLLNNKSPKRAYN